MSQDVIASLLQRVQDLERTSVRLRTGLVTDDAPLTVDLGASGTPVTVAHIGDDLSVADKAAVLVAGNDLLAMGAVRTGGLFVGQLTPSARGAAPPGWLTCAGQSLLRTDYAALFTAIGTTYGSADGTHFTLPDLRGRVPVGLDNQGGTDAGRLAAANTLGGSGGAETHTLNVGEMPAHSHPQFVITTDVGSGQLAPLGRNNNAGIVNGYSTDATGGDGAHNNMPPYLLVSWLVYAGA